MAHAKNHDYHILAPSIWPLAGALGGFLSGGVQADDYGSVSRGHKDRLRQSGS